MKKYLPFLSLLLIVVIGIYMVMQKETFVHKRENLKEKTNSIGTFDKMPTCARPPLFLGKLGIPQPVVIDLSQKRFKGIALLYGKGFQKVLHPKQWEQYGHFSTYSVDEQGNIYLVPTPFISIRPTTFNLQKNIYKLESKSGKLSLFMHLDDIEPSANNPYGVNAIVYDCDDHTLWVAAIDESDYQAQKGVIYHIDPKSKKVLQRVEGRDILSLALLKSSKGKFLLAGSARDNALYAYPIRNQQLRDRPIKLLELPHVNEHIRKIKIKGKNILELQSIPFSYTLIAQSAKKDRTLYDALYGHNIDKWKVIEK